MIPMIFLVVLHLLCDQIRAISENSTQKILNQLKFIKQQIDQLTPSYIEHFLEPRYRFTQIAHSTLQIQPNNIPHQIQMFSSINIHSSQKISYPILLRNGNEFISIKGKVVVAFKQNSQILVSSSRGQFTYFAQLSQSKVSIKKLIFTQGKPELITEFSFNKQEIDGQISDFSVVFSINKKLFGFGTNKGEIYLYKVDGFVDRVRIGQKNQGIRLRRFNNHLLVYTTHRIYIIKSSNPKKQNIVSCSMMKLDARGILSIEFDNSKFKKFYVVTTNRIYQYQFNDKCDIIAIYPMAFQQKQQPQILQHIFPVDQMLITEYTRYPGLYLYYNTSDRTYNKLRLPETGCKNPQSQYIKLSSKSSTQHILCDFCLESSNSTAIKFSCYNIQTGTFSDRNDGAEFSKLRIPLIIVSLLIIMYFGISKSKKKKDVGPYGKILTQDRKIEDQKFKKLIGQAKS